jgi:hypothetical protein
VCYECYLLTSDVGNCCAGQVLQFSLSSCPDSCLRSSWDTSSYTRKPKVNTCNWLQLTCKYYCKHSIIIEYHTTSGSSTRKAYVAHDKQRKGRRKHSFANMITPNCLQYITQCACITMYLFNQSLLMTRILFPTCECENINIYSRLAQRCPSHLRSRYIMIYSTLHQIQNRGQRGMSSRSRPYITLNMHQKKTIGINYCGSWLVNDQ